jgi:hypothetical protein
MKITLKNVDANVERTCLFTNQPFTNQNNVCFFDEYNRPISPAEARSKSWEFDSQFRPPANILNRESLGLWLSEIGIARNSQAYREAYSKFGENLPPVAVMDIHKGR